VDNKNVPNQLQNAGIKTTPIREAIINILLNQDTPVSADHIHTLLEKDGISAHRATLYRDLKIFVDKNIVKQITLIGEHAELYTINKEHTHHFKCRQCSVIQPFNTTDLDEEIMSFIKKKASKHGWSQTTFTFKIYGFCSKCTEKEVKKQ
jgi:Fur family peroxide stress response transcriptional regulator